MQTLEAKNIIIATGSEARMIPGLEPDPEFILTNIEILDLAAVPRSLVVIGGDGTMSIAHRFEALGLPVVGVPKTIDNDLEHTDRTFGFDSAVAVVADTFWHAKTALDALAIEWDEGPNAKASSADVAQTLKAGLVGLRFKGPNVYAAPPLVAKCRAGSPACAFVTSVERR